MSVKNAIVLASGGIDSTACIAYYQESGFNVEAVFIDYGNPANRIECYSITKLSLMFGIKLTILEMKGADIRFPGEIRGRNAFLIFAALMAKPDYSGLLALGIHGEDEYYDCSRKFCQLISTLVADYTLGKVQLDIPFIDLGKPEIVDYCKAHNVPLLNTYSCQMGTNPPCGKCPSCKDRIALGLE